MILANMWNKNIICVLGLIILTVTISEAQCYWQQQADYTMDIKMNVKKNCMDGDQTIVYTNNSPDVLDKIYYHLYFNAFQPGSMMDVRSSGILDADPRIGLRISSLTKDEIGYQKIKSLKQDGESLKYSVEGTILEVELNKSIQPGSTTVLDMKFEAQVPIQIRRTGRDNAEGVRYSIAQWYPKLCEYDEDGWHPNPYIAREFYGVWGDWDVRIEIDGDYIVAGTGTLQNEQDFSVKKKKRTWHFKAENVHDFVWAADPDYKHIKLEREDGITLNFYFQPDERTNDNWAMLPSIMDKALDYINEICGTYPYPQYSIIQGGDGGMEYPMATLITGKRSLTSLVGVSVHEILHSWYQLILGTNESLYPWMDEGFTNYVEAEVLNYLRKTKALPGGRITQFPHASAQTGYRNFARSGFEEPMSTHADHYHLNQAYNIGSYVKGEVFLDQLSYIIGKETLDRVMLRYFDEWKFKHPDGKDFLRIAEKESGLVLDWYYEYWVNTTNVIDYAVDTLKADGRRHSIVELKKIGSMPMPIDVYVKRMDGTTKCYHIPLTIMRGSKQDEGLANEFEVVEDWPWTNALYELRIKEQVGNIQSISIDPTGRLADIQLNNNDYPAMD